VSGQLQAPVALPPGKEPPVRRLGGPQSRSGRHGEVKILNPDGTRTPNPLSNRSELHSRRSRLWTVLKMVYNTQNYGYFGTLSIVRYSKNLENTTFRKLDLFPSSGEGRDTYSVGSRRKIEVSSKGPNRVGVSPSPEDGNRFSFRNDVLSRYLEYLTMDKVQKPCNSEDSRRS
jgi:hypothetical protein